MASSRFRAPEVGWVERDVQAGFVKVGDRQHLPRRYSIGFSSGTALELWAAVYVDDEGGLHCREFSVRATDVADVTTAVARQFPIGTLLEQSKVHALYVEADEPDGSVVLKPASGQHHAELAEAARLRTRGPDSATLRRVADVYRQAIEEELPPTIAVAEAFGRPRSTAARWVQRARKRGFLNEAPGMGQAGEAPEREEPR